MAQTQLKSQRTARDWPFQVKPLHPVLGCEITGITLEQAVSPAMFAKVYEAFLDYELILFRDVDLPPATQVAFAQQFRRGAISTCSASITATAHPGDLHAVQPRQGRQSERQAPRPRHAVLAHRRLLERAHRAGDHDVFGDRAAAGRGRRNAIRRHVFRPTTCCPPTSRRRSRASAPSTISLSRASAATARTR